ncbi:uncharacterized protein LOC116347896 isoform X2 [Contarinia nasturtii]|uniref:uncharacterized protein LOC116347896 isoform X2 n=1 Tax=Contarinia nasturtii TaxID=265458 RepID=UPI0012D387C9|nr:uncharacterized protein LOC116347896 isoform X2 [Contarinia nasturtii]
MTFIDITDKLEKLKEETVRLQTEQLEELNMALEALLQRMAALNDEIKESFHATCRKVTELQELLRMETELNRRNTQMSLFLLFILAVNIFVCFWNFFNSSIYK